MRKLLLLAALCAALATPARAALLTTNSVVTFTGNGVTTAFATGYRFLDTSHLVVQKTDLSAVTVTLVLGTDYSVTGANAAAGGTVTLVVAPPSGHTLKIKRSTPRTQNCTLRNLPILTPKTVEDCFDRQEMQLQEMNDGTFTQLLATPVTTAQASTAAPIEVPNSGNTNSAGSSSAFAAADHVHKVAVGPMASATSAAGQSITSSAFQIVVYGTELRDTDSAYDPATGRFTVPAGKGGDYFVSCGIEWNAGLTGQSALAVFVNAATKLEGSKVNPAATDGVQTSGVVNTAAGDLIDCRAFQNSGGTVALRSASPSGVFITIKRIQ